MTTIAVAQKDGEIAIGADGRRSGYYELIPADAAEIKKINQVGNNYIGTCGPATWPTVIEIYFAGLDKIPNMRTEAEIFQVITKLQDLAKDEYNLCPEPRKGELDGSGMDMLIANPFGIFSVSSRRSVNKFNKYWAEGTGGEYALGAMYMAYDTQAKVAEIVEAGLKAGAEFNVNTAPPFKIFSLSQDNHEAKKADT